MNKAFASFHQRTLTGPDLPGFESESVTIRKLNEQRLAEAARAVQVKALREVEAMGGMNILTLADAIEKRAKTQQDEQQAAAIAEAKRRQAERLEKVKADPFLAYDRDTLVLLGVAKWSFKDEDGRLVPINAERVEDMEPKVKERIARAIYELSVPSEDATKNASGPSSLN